MSEATMVPNYVRRFAEQIVKDVDKGTQQVTHLITTGAVDRMGDVVEPRGADLNNFMRNPIALVNHDYRFESIIGRAVSMEITDAGLVATTKFRDTALAKEAFSLTAEGLGGWSIGFRPIEYDSRKDDDGRTRGVQFKRWELLEYSLVAVPANQEIVNNAIQRGLVTPEHAHSFFLLESSPIPEPIEATPTEDTVALQGATAAHSIEEYPLLRREYERNRTPVNLSVEALKRHLRNQNLAAQVREVVKEHFDGKRDS